MTALQEAHKPPTELIDIGALLMVSAYLSSTTLLNVSSVPEPSAAVLPQCSHSVVAVKDTLGSSEP